MSRSYVKRRKQPEPRVLPSWPAYSEKEIAAAAQVLESGRVNYWTGNHCREFEQEFAAYTGVSYAVSLANGTLALDIALRCLSIGPGDEVIVTPRSYFASASCVSLLGATPIFADVDSQSQNVSADTIGPLVSERTKAILVVHLAGWPCDMDPILDLADRAGIKVIEDCAQAHGARYKTSPVGSMGHIGAFSFCQDKIMSTAGEGGMLVTDCRDCWQQAWAFKDHGKNPDKVRAYQEKPGFKWLHDNYGSNYRMTEIQAAIGRIQLESLDDWVRIRARNAKILYDTLKSCEILRLPVPPSNVEHAYYKFYAFVDPDKLKPDWTRDRILDALIADGLPGWSGSCPEIYREGAYQHLGHQSLSVASELGETSIMLPVHPTLSPENMKEIGEAIVRVANQASKF